MFRTTLHYVLLLAVSYSQVLGGVSCCCLGRSLIESISGKPLVADVAPSKSVAAQPSRCPKCAARPTGKPLVSAPPVTKTSSPSQVVVCRGGQCNCSMVDLNASGPKEPFSAPGKSVGWAFIAVASPKPVAIAISSLGRFELPLRYGGRSWQTIACVWKN
jgi:hypothetical protein